MGVVAICGTLESLLKQPVLDETELAGRYDYDFKAAGGDFQSLKSAVGDQGVLELAEARRKISVLVIESTEATE